MMCSTSASSGRGTATRTISQPDAVNSAICCSVAFTSAVFVVVIDWTLTGESLPEEGRVAPDAADAPLPTGEHVMPASLELDPHLRPLRGAAAHLWWAYYRVLRNREGVIAGAK